MDENKNTYKTISVEHKHSNSSVFHLYLHRPSHRNALSLDFFSEFPHALHSLDHNPNVNVIILAGTGDHFCSGIDINALTHISKSHSDSVSSSAERLRREIKHLQAAITALEKCRKPVIASIHGACIGGGIDLITACDIRCCSNDAFFSVKEVDLAITADLGTLQRLPSIVGFGNAMDLALTARTFSASEAHQMGLVSRPVLPSRSALDDYVAHLAGEIGSKSPLTISGTKAVLIKSRDMSIPQGLDYVATWNSSMLLSPDLHEAISAFRNKRKPVFSKL